MTRISRPRWSAATLLAGATALLVLSFTACGPQHPNSVFTGFTEFNRDVTGLHRTLFLLGTIVFVFVEALLLYVIIKFRAKPGQAEPRHVHGNTTLEVLWTAIPAVILLFIAIPTVRTIFRTQAKARPGALQVEVIGHQWWWEFRYPEYNITTANELYLPVGRTVNFALRTADVLHSFWIPQLGGKRDLIANHTNYLWFTPDSVGTVAFNGQCAEYCGASHANMKFRAYTVTPAQFESWVRGQQAPALYGADAPPGQTGQTSGPQTRGQAAADSATPNRPGPGRDGRPATGSDAASRARAAEAQNIATAPQSAAAISAGTPEPGYSYPLADLPAHVRPSTPVPAGLRYNESLVGDPARGKTAFISCIGCHYVNGNRLAVGRVGPNLTHIGTRNTIAGGLFPNDTRHLALWLKNSRAMKPGVTMPTLGLGEIDPATGQPVRAGGLTDQQIADLVAYLQALK